ncbi:MAG: fibrobacter succinogenes major paralogous domain-containing protein, partial [Bacteroidales bacterium]
KLYNWYTVADNRGLCPTGWHVPTDSEFSDLTTYLGGSSFAGGKLKEVGLSHWINPNTGADNISDFTALPGGVRSFTGNYFSLSYYCYLWSATESTPTYSWYYYLSYNDVAFNRVDNNKKLGHSVRCIKDTVASYKVLDIDGNAYDTVHIGTQVWMKQNLKTTKFSNGDGIPNYIDNMVWSGLSTAAYCNYNNDTNNANIYGRLYNWYSVSDSRNLCPNGWHVPTDIEFTDLTSYLGGDLIAGGKMKEVGLVHWNSPNTGATNQTGFTSLPGGYRSTSGSYTNLGYYDYLWSSSLYDVNNAWYIYMHYNYSAISRNNNNKKLGHAVRCMMN